MPSLRPLLLLALFALTPPALVCAPRAIRINLGTLAPRGSSYHQALQTMGAEWRKVSNGRVRLVIYPDGTQGTESDMVKLMRINALQAGLVTSTGLELIEESVSGLQKLPLMFRDLDEFDHIMRMLSPRMEMKIEEKGFHVLFWLDTGWLRWFSINEAITPADFSKEKIFVWADPKQVEIFRRLGQNPVNLESNDLPAALQTGMVTAMPAPPIYVLATQLDRRAKHMLRLNYAPLIGAAVVSHAAWEKIPADLRPKLVAIAQKAGDEIRVRSRAESEEAVAVMQKRGLIVHELTPEARDAWTATAEKAFPMIRSLLMPEETFDEVQRELAAFRAQRGTK